MEEINGNTASELLNLLIDGELESSQEVSLYASLTENDELRNEMRELLAIRESIHKDTEAFTPPRTTKRAVLTAVGLTPGAVANAPITQVAIQAGFWSGFWAKVWVPVVSAVVATIITSLLFLNFYDTGKTVSSSGSVLKKIPVVSSSEKVAPEKPANILSTNGINKSIRKNRNIGITNASRVVPAPNVIYNEDYISSDNQTIQPIETASLGTEIYKTNSLNYSESRNIGIPVIALTPNQFSSLNRGKLSGLDITLILRGISAKSYPTVYMPSQWNPIISNFSLGGYVTLVDGLDVGMEAGLENFGLVYFNYETIRIDKKNPFLYWAGIGLKGQITKHIELLAGAKPYAQVFVGGTNIGPNIRMAGGLEYSWDNGLGFIIGIEGSSLFYNVQDNWYSTEKLGFTYGVLYSF
ncbi:MAG: hypothetical protein A2X61_04635 [Ignavibacteria bacterium GWB2_35_12]|nr:MAG: hypothetical protein A2X63_13430 [Ignavibacteria bacterium GWA2_35_8]OGU41917.1 MAG: hypothetical protein A2X61_04635 [Ignavibacteria bacterium GWB2_35_12]OGU87175.1 MAG: hypothetical protein A2220_07825 [Ignavibacteria bacterium RIFOXYA2_FULL_35_10]OGV24591.1 MAG: hypothetical protein A2475_09225 [Ignavibacteria bacterium RIFOXYC2_FULL_35_21]